MIAPSLVLFFAVALLAVASCNLVQTPTTTTPQVKCNGLQTNPSESGRPLALIRLVNAAAPLPYGSGKTKGELPLCGQSEREALRWHSSVSPTVRSPYPTGQVRRKESYRCAASRNERHCASTAAQSAGLKGEGALPFAYRKSAQYASHSAIF